MLVMPHQRRLLRIAAGLMLVMFVLLAALLHWVVGMHVGASVRAAALVTGITGVALLLLQVVLAWSGRLVDRAMDAAGRIWRRTFPRFSRAQRTERLAALAALLDAVEAEMRRLGWWADDPPALRERYLNGELRSYADAPSFELWLQCVFLPNARAAVAGDRLPPSSVGVMAMREYDHHSEVPEAFALLRLLQRFDHEVNQLVGHDPLMQ